MFGDILYELYSLIFSYWKVFLETFLILNTFSLAHSQFNLSFSNIFNINIKIPSNIFPVFWTGKTLPIRRHKRKKNSKFRQVSRRDCFIATCTTFYLIISCSASLPTHSPSSLSFALASLSDFGLLNQSIIASSAPLLREPFLVHIKSMLPF